MSRQTTDVKTSLKPLRKYMFQYKWHYFAGLFLLVGVNLLQLQLPMIIGKITDGLSNNLYTMKDLYAGVLQIVLLGISLTFGRFGWRYYIFGTSRKIEYGLRNDFFGHLEKLSLRFYNENKTGDLMAYATNDLNAIRNLIGPGVLMLLDAISLAAMVVYQMIRQIDLNLTLVSILPLPFIAISSLAIGKMIRERFRIKQEAFAQMSDMVQENISGIRIVKAYVQEVKEVFSFNKSNQNNYDKNMKVVWLSAIMEPSIILVSGIAIAIVLGYGGTLSITGIISLGDFVAFIQYLLMLIWPMIAFGWFVNMYSQGMASLQRFNEILDVKPEIVDQSTTHMDVDIKGQIEFRNVSFQYPNAVVPALSHLNVEILSGQTIGIVGRTGSGKTTLVNLLLRLFENTQGEIEIDGHSIKSLPLQKLRASIGYVPQDNFLFSDSIENNIAFGLKTWTHEQVVEAAEMADVHDNIMAFQEQYNTIVGERGVTLSGGQKQRVSIARALIKTPPILILDDAVSAVDTKTEEKILSQLKRARTNQTTIIIAHRISTIQNADQIWVLDEGKVVEQGTHEALLACQGLYAEMYMKQQLERALEEEVDEEPSSIRGMQI